MDYNHGISGSRLIFFRSLDAVISSEAVSGRSRVLRELNEGSACIGNTFGAFVSFVESTQTRIIFGDAVSIEGLVALVSDKETKYSRTLLPLKG